MKMHSFKYLVKEGFSNVWANRLMSIASIGVLVACMVIIGLAVLVTENVNKALGNLEQQNVVMVYMKDYNWALYDDTDKPETDSDTTSSDTSSDTQSAENAEGGENTENSENAENTESGEQTPEEEKEKPDVNGILSTDYIIHNEEEAKALCDKISKIDNVAKVEFVSSEEGLESVKENMLEGQEEYFTFLDDEYGNPLSMAAKVTMKDMSKFDATIKKIEALSDEGVDMIQSQKDLAAKITAIKKGVGIAGFWIIAILMIIALVIVSNTIRVTMYNRKLEISIMKAVGATNAFVRIPFVVEGMIIGLISALLSEGITYFCYRIATETITNMLSGMGGTVAFGELAWELLLLYAGIGVIAGALGSVIMIGKYLRKEGSEFAAI